VNDYTKLGRAAALIAAALLSACGGSTTPNGSPAATVIGQPTFNAGQPNRGSGANANTLHTPIGNVAIAADGTLLIPDAFNGRVLAYRTVPDSNEATADFVLGKPILTAPPSGTATREFIETPTGVSIAAGKMAITDAGANRVLIYSSLPSSSGASASFVVGQSNFTDNEPQGCTQTSLNRPRSAVLTENGKLVVADTLNHRVMIWNAVPQADGQPADAVLGQADFVHCTANDQDQNRAADATPRANTMNEPIAVWSDGRRLIVVDSLNSRVLIWTQMPTDGSQNFKPADVVLGQIGFTGSTGNDANGDGIEDANPGATTMLFPGAVHSDGTRLAVADTVNHRVLLWDTIPTQSGTPSDRVFGQAEFNRGTENDTDGDGTANAAPSDSVFNLPRGVLLSGPNLFVTDTLNHRVLVFRLH